jgi:hypothetical protein
MGACKSGSVVMKSSRRYLNLEQIEELIAPAAHGAASRLFGPLRH